MTFEEFRGQIMAEAKKRPSYIRKGQEIFNYIDATYGVARYIQFDKHIDCFYDDSQIDDFINAAYTALKDKNII